MFLGKMLSSPLQPYPCKQTNTKKEKYVNQLIIEIIIITNATVRLGRHWIKSLLFSAKKAYN